MLELLKRFAADVTVPLVIDSTEVPVIEAALKLAGGKCTINSINLEDGEKRLDTVCALAKRHGAALIALTIDEEGMAKTCDRKVAVARRIYELVTERHGISPSDLIFDLLTFTICTGNEEDRKLGLETRSRSSVDTCSWFRSSDGTVTSVDPGYSYALGSRMFQRQSIE